MMMKSDLEYVRVLEIEIPEFSHLMLPIQNEILQLAKVNVEKNGKVVVIDTRNNTTGTFTNYDRLLRYMSKACGMNF